MHIHGQIPAVQSNSFYGIAGDQQSLQARRAASIRRRTRIAGRDTLLSESPAGSQILEAMQMIDQWTSTAGDRQTSSGSDLI